MASEIITDDFNRSNQHLGGSVSAEGWEWVKTRPNPDFMDIFDNGARNGSGLGFSIYMADVFLAMDGDPLGAAGDNFGVQIDVLDGLNSRGFDLPLLVSNPYDGSLIYASFDHATGVAIVRQRIAGSAETTLGTDTISVPSLPYTAVFFLTRPLGLFGGTTATLRIDGVNVLSGLSVSTAQMGPGRQYAGLAFKNEVPNIRYDNFKAGLSWLLESGVSAPSQLDDSNPLVQRNTLDEQRRSALLGGRQDTILTSPLGLTDDVPIAKIHLLGRC